MAEIRDLKTWRGRFARMAQMLLAFALFMLAIDLLTVSLVQINSKVAEDIFTATQNPFIGLLVGLLMTALIQSSSTVTSMTVAVVASGSISLQQAIPLIMGANIGTTLTSTLVSFTYILKKGEFRKALSAGVLHDFFNIFTAIILFPLEYYFGFLSQIASSITASFFVTNLDFDGNYTYNVLFTRPLTLFLLNLIGIPLIGLILSVLILFLSIRFLSVTVYKAFLSPNYKKISKHIFKSPYGSFLYGLFFTAAIQSSTVTTSLMVTAVATKKVSLIRAFPFIIGANIGTTITAGIAAIYKTEAAISIALVHFLFNFIGALIFIPFPGIRNIPARLATYFAKKSTKTKSIGLAYILFTFFILPFLLIYFNQQENGNRQDAKIRHQQEIGVKNQDSR